MDFRDDNGLIFSRVVFAVLSCTLIATDLYLLAVYGREGTISAMLRQTGDKWAMFPYLVAFGLGAFFYHLFGSR